MCVCFQKTTFLYVTTYHLSFSFFYFLNLNFLIFFWSTSCMRFWGGGEEKNSFLEIEAGDGVLFSNSLLFEHCFGWHGVLIEPRPRSFGTRSFGSFAIIGPLLSRQMSPWAVTSLSLLSSCVITWTWALGCWRRMRSTGHPRAWWGRILSCVLSQVWPMKPRLLLLNTHTKTHIHSYFLSCVCVV